MLRNHKGASPKRIPKRDLSDTPFGRAPALRLPRGPRVGIGLRTIADDGRRGTEESGGERRDGKMRRTRRPRLCVLLLLPPLPLRRGGRERKRGCARHGGDEAFGGGRVAMAAAPAGQQTPVLPRRSPSARRLRFTSSRRVLAALFCPRRSAERPPALV